MPVSKPGPSLDDILTNTIEQSIKDATADESDPIESDDPAPVEDAPVEDPVVEPPSNPVVENPVEPVVADPAKPVVPAADVPVVEKKKRGPLPYDRHEAILTTERRKHETALAAVSAQVKAYETPEFQQRLGAVLLAETQPEKFLALLENDARYKDLLKTRYAPPAPVEKAVEEPPLEMPKPNIVYDDGRLGYDEAGANALAQYHAKTVERAMREEMKALRASVEPIAKEFTTKAEGQRLHEEALERNRALLANARTWRGFTENEPAIKEYVLNPANRGVTLDQAYQKVVVEKAFEDDKAKEARIRAAIEADISRRAAAGQAVPAAGQAPAAGAPAAAGGRRSESHMEDIIRNAIRTVR